MFEMNVSFSAMYTLKLRKTLIKWQHVQCFCEPERKFNWMSEFLPTMLHQKAF